MVSLNYTFRYALVERARGSWLRDVQHIIINGGNGPGSLRDNEGAPFLSFDRHASWNASWGRAATTGHDKQKNSGFVLTYPDNPGCTFEFVNPKRKGGQKVARPAYDCNDTTLRIPSYVRIGKYKGAHVSDALFSNY